MIEGSYGQVRCIISDRDAAVTSKKFRRGIYNKYGIGWIFLKSRGKSFRAEKMIGYVKTHLSMAMKAHPGEKNWTRFLEGIVKYYNSQHVTGTNVIRSSVNKENYMKLLEQLYNSKEPTLMFNVATSRNFLPKTQRMLWKYAVGDVVLLYRKSNYKLKQSIFSKNSVLGAFDDTTPRTIKSLYLKANGLLFLTPVYRLAGLNDYYYESELRPFREDATAANNGGDEEGAIVRPSGNANASR
jgi:hypothetical protein